MWYELLLTGESEDTEGVKQATPLSGLRSWHKYVYMVFVSSDESHYAVWTVWISVVKG